MLEHNAHFAAEITAQLDAPDNDQAPVTNGLKPSGNPGYQFPARVWGAMFACYGIFFLAILIATGGSAYARFAIIVSVLYTVMYFGVARIIAKLGGPEVASPLDGGKPLQTWTGPMSAGSVYSQVLIVPFVLALFGFGMAVIIGVIA